MHDRPAHLLTIGQFAALTDISRPSLRRYDELGLLRPVLVDEETGYRYYSSGQLDVAETVRLLRDLQVPLADIVELLETADEAAVQRLLDAHRRRISALVERETAILARVEQVLSSGLPLVPQSHVVTLVDLPDATVISCAGESGPTLDALTAARASCEKTLRARLAAMGLSAVGPLVFLYELDVFAPWYSPARFQACAVLDPATPAPPDAWVLEGCTAACTVHRGPWDGLRAAWAALIAWTGRSGYEVSSPVRVTYEIGPAGAADPAGYVTQIALPVRRGDDGA
jgi:DNA-binding transcriptional MerR regulator